MCDEGALKPFGLCLTCLALRNPEDGLMPCDFTSEIMRAGLSSTMTSVYPQVACFFGVLWVDWKAKGTHRTNPGPAMIQTAFSLGPRPSTARNRPKAPMFFLQVRRTSSRIRLSQARARRVKGFVGLHLNLSGGGGGGGDVFPDFPFAKAAPPKHPPPK